MSRTVVLGIGNPYVSDDGVGIYVARTLGKIVRDNRVICTELATANLDVLECLEGCDQAIIIDAARTGRAPTGFLWSFSLTQTTSFLPSLSLHTIGLATVFDFGGKLGIPLPPIVTVFAVEAADTETFHEGCTDLVQVVLPEVVSEILRFLKTTIPDLHHVQHQDGEMIAA